MLVKDEEWILPTTLRDLSKYTDEIVISDGSSHIKSKQILTNYSNHIIPQKMPQDMSRWRSDLLKKGRELNGTHFIFLDADESFTNNFFLNYKKILKSMRPGQSCFMEWIMLWKSSFKQRFDNSVWVKNYKDFIFCDDQISEYPKIKFHEPRTPIDLKKNNIYKIKPSIGAVLHFQAVPLERYLSKQAYKYCRDLLNTNLKSIEINKQYSITKDNPKIKSIDVPNNWIDQFNIEELKSLENVKSDYYIKKIFEYFKEFGVKKFEHLDIWHIDKLRKFYFDSLGVNPVPLRYSYTFKEKLNDLKKTFIKMIEKNL